MKKIVKCILPIMSSAALVTPVLVSCGKPIEYYQVTQQEMLDTLDMKDVQYLQVESHSSITSVRTNYVQYSPTAFHQIWEDTDEYYEEYVIKAGENYTKYYRESPAVPLIGPETVFAEDFSTPRAVASILYVIYNHVVDSGFVFDVNDKSYKFDLNFLEDYKEGSFYFENKKIVKYELSTNLNNLQTKKTPYKQIYTYKHITPTLQ